MPAMPTPNSASVRGSGTFASPVSDDTRRRSSAWPARVPNSRVFTATSPSIATERPDTVPPLLLVSAPSAASVVSGGSAFVAR